MFGCWHQEEVLEVREGHDFARIFVVSVIEYSSVECHKYVDDEEYVHHCPVVHRHCASLHAEGVALLQAKRVRSCVSVRVGVQKCVCVCVCVCVHAQSGTAWLPTHAAARTTRKLAHRRQRGGWGGRCSRPQARRGPPSAASTLSAYTHPLRSSGDSEVFGQPVLILDGSSNTSSRRWQRGHN